MKYYNNNLVYYYRLYLMLATCIVAIAGMLTFYVLQSNYETYENHMKTTYVYSTNGASIEVNLNKK